MNTFVAPKKTAKDWDKADIKHALEKKGWNILRLAKASGYSNASALRKAFDSSYPKAEKIIASAIGLPPEIIWPSRYEKRNFTPVLSPASPVCVPFGERPAVAAVN